MNIYNKLISMLPSTRVDVGIVLQTYQDGVLVQLQNGGYLRALGQAAVGTRVFVRGGQVLGPAPNLSGSEIEI